jgi:hypothetical protein
VADEAPSMIVTNAHREAEDLLLREQQHARACGISASADAASAASAPGADEDSGQEMRAELILYPWGGKQLKIIKFTVLHYTAHK